MAFINRTEELASLQSEYTRKGGSFVIVYGRRRTGKTTLLRKFLENKNALYYLADKQVEQQQITQFKNQFATFSKDTLLPSLPINHWDQVFQLLDQYAAKNKSKKFILVLDEFQYLTVSNPAFASMLQRYWDNHLQHRNIMLILCGSLISMMFKHALSYQAPLFGRRTAQIHVHPFRYQHIHPFLKEKNEKEKMEFYALCGGIPRYLLEMHPSKSFLQNIKENVLDKNKLLYSEPRFILNDELTETSTYFSLLQTIAAGNHKIGHISQVLQIPNNRLTAHLDKLRELDLVERRVPVTEKNPSKSRRGLYFIKDHFFRFWFRFVFPFQSELEMGNTQHILQTIEKDLSNYMGLAFEDVCRQSVFYFSPFLIQRNGNYWDKNTEIDIVAMNETEKKILFGECKWSNQLTDSRVLHELKEKAKTIDWNMQKRKEYFILFSKNGFSKELQLLAKKDKNITLIDWGAIKTGLWDKFYRV